MDGAFAGRAETTGMQRLNAEYAKQFGIEAPSWPRAKA
jgi:hypothetical protein